MRLGLSARLSLLVATVLVLALIAFAWFWTGLRQTESEIAQRAAALLAERARTDLAVRATQTADYLGQALVNPLFYVDLLSIQDLLAPVQRQADVASVVVYDQAGRMMHDGSVDLAAFGEQVDNGLLPADGKPVLSWGRELLEVTAPIRLDERLIGAVRIGFHLNPIETESAAARVEVDRQLSTLHRRQGQSFAALGIAILVLGAGTAWLIARGWLRPIQELAVMSRQLAAGLYAKMPISSKRQDELGELVRAFEQMSESLASHEAAMRREAQEDSLTGLANRRRFGEQLDRALRHLAQKRTQAALVFFDLDAFKQVNDALGHESGDFLLRETARMLSKAAEELGLGEHGIVARLGGDEFLALFTGDQAEERARLCAERLLADLNGMRPSQLLARNPSASPGMAVYPAHGDTAKSLLKAADLAMYAAKRAGGGKLCRFEPLAAEGDYENLLADLTQQLREGNAAAQLHLLYQPIVDLNSRKTLGVEALIRWHHPQLGELPPVAFLQPALRAGLGIELSRLTVKMALTDLADWLNQDPARFVSINLDQASWNDGELLTRLREQLADAGVKPQQLCLELPERLYWDQPEQSQRQVARLRELGVQMWLDDVDGGAERASTMRHFRVRGIKLDHRLVAGMLRKPEDLRQVQVLIQVAIDAQLEVVAEAVESEAQVKLLTAAGCTLGQGFGLVMPISAADLLKREATDYAASL